MKRLYSLLLICFLYPWSIYAQVAGPDLTTPADNTLNYKFAKVTYTWTSVTDATIYELQVCKTDSFKTSDGVKTYQSIDTTTFTPTDFLEFNTKYYWRVRAKIDNDFTAYSSTFNFTTGTPSSSAETADAKILFKHTEGRIAEITYKQGSNNQLLDTTLNSKNKTGLGRVTGEIGTRIVSWTEAVGNYTYNYENILYGTKTINVKWNSDSVIVSVTMNLSASKSAILASSWKPGGDIGPLYDNLLYSTPSDAAVKKTLVYPTLTSIIYTGNTNLIAAVDERYDECFGFVSSDSVSTALYQDVSLGSSFSFPSSSSAQTKKITFAITNKSDFYTWASKKYILVNFPQENIKLKDQSSQTIKWESFGVTGNVNINLSTDGGSSYSVLANNTPNDGTQTVTLPNLSAFVPLTNCLIRITGTGVTAYSKTFSIIRSQVSVFSIPTNLTAAPSEKISVPIIVTPIASDSIYAFDIRLNYDKDIVTYLSYTLDAQLSAKNWTNDVTNNSSSGFLQIGAFRNDLGFAINSADTLMTLTFTIKPSAMVGLQSVFKINNDYLSAADDSAKSMSVLGSDGLVTLYSRISGNLLYFTSKAPIVGDSLLRFITYDFNGSVVDTVFAKTASGGNYEFSNKVPGNTTVIEPVNKLSYPATIPIAVDAVDAAKAFAGRNGGSATLSEYQKIAADINNDGMVSSSDALAILKISLGEITPQVFGLNNWVFIDSTYKIVANNWLTIPQNLTYDPLDSIKTKQSFWGVMRGDVDCDGGSYQPVRLKTPGGESVNGTTVVYSVPVSVAAQPGDTISIPFNVKLNGLAIGAFNASLQMDNDLLAYTDEYNIGPSVPGDEGWIVNAHLDEQNKLNIGATDFSGILNPITNDGTIAYLKFIVNENANEGDSCAIEFTYASAANAKLTDISASATDGKVIISGVTSVNGDNIIYEYNLEQNYPNPFNPATLIRYSVARESRVNIEIYNSLGQRVETLYNGIQQPGNYNIKWSAENFASGIYFYRIHAGEFVQTRKMMLLK